MYSKCNLITDYESYLVKFLNRTNKKEYIFIVKSSEELKWLLDFMSDTYYSLIGIKKVNFAEVKNV